MITTISEVMDTGFIKIQQIADDLADHPMLRDIPFDRIVNYAQQLIKLIGSPKLFTEKTTIVSIKNYRGVLPCDFVSMLQVRGMKDLCEYVVTMDNFHNSERKHDFVGTNTYKIQGDVIITSQKDEDLEIAYRAIPVDENGWPMLPDNEPFKLALEAYIKKCRFNILFDQGQINYNVFDIAQRDYLFRVGQAHTSLIMPTYDEMETITNVWNNLIPRVSAHRNGFATEHNKEFIKQH